MAQTREICVASEEKKTDTLDVCRLEWMGQILRRSHRNFTERILKFCLRQHCRTVWNRYSKYLSNGPSKRFFLFGKHVRIWVWISFLRFTRRKHGYGRNIVDVAWRCVDMKQIRSGRTYVYVMCMEPARKPVEFRKIVCLHVEYFIRTPLERAHMRYSRNISSPKLRTSRFARSETFTTCVNILRARNVRICYRNYVWYIIF